MNKIFLMLSAFTLGTAVLVLPSEAQPLSVTATVSPAAPQTGDNKLDLLVSDAAGKPVIGLKLNTSVAMTSMDMGTTHPAFIETGNGHYTTKVNFGMDGPWRVVVRTQSGKVAVLDFNAGSQTPWKSPQIKATGALPTQPAAPAQAANPIAPANPTANAMPGMDMGGASLKPTDKPVTPTANAMTGMDMGEMKPMKMTGISDMKTATVPELKETGTYTATGTEDWKKQAGFGRNAPMVGMMNQMMVGGSGMEGMKMAPMTMKFDEKNYAKPDASEAADSMPGMKMDTPAVTRPDTPAASGPVNSKPVNIMAVMASAPKSGDNPLDITLADAQGKPVVGATITTSVAMTSMDMGTTHPAVTEKGAGKYAVTVNFSMAGPWRVTVKVTAPSQKPQSKAFDFTAK